MNYALAIDIGASSGRHILGWMENGVLKTEEIYRFPNGMISRNGTEVWDTDALLRHILEGLRRCKESGRIPSTIGIDTWGVDYVLLGENGARLGEAVAYRDPRTAGMPEKLEQTLPFKRAYAISGIARESFNTVYQLMADFEKDPARQNAAQLLFMPCYLSYLLTGRARNEYSIASTSGLLDAETRQFAPEILNAAGIPGHLFPDPPAMPGTILGPLRPEIAGQIGYQTDVMLTASHDTASAFHAVPCQPGDAILSSGTWSLLGTVLPRPIRTDAARLSGFTNEGGADGILFLRNICGLWILQSLRREFGGDISFSEMTDLAEQGSSYEPVIDTGNSRFLNPASMQEEILSALREQGAPLPAGRQELLYCVNHSLAVSYAGAIRQMQTVTGTPVTRLTIVGGGGQNKLLNRLAARETALPVVLGPTEGTAEGNLRIQLAR